MLMQLGASRAAPSALQSTGSPGVPRMMSTCLFKRCAIPLLQILVGTFASFGGLWKYADFIAMSQESAV